MNALLLYCRAGFEKECAAEIQQHSEALGIFGYIKTATNSAYVLFYCYEQEAADQLAHQVKLKQLVFARQLIVGCAALSGMPLKDRISAIVTHSTHLPLCGSLMVETADSSEAKVLSKLCRKLTVPLRRELRKLQHLLPEDNARRPTMHLMMTSHDSGVLGYSYTFNHSPEYMGILRLKFPNSAPSRSTLKLEEAFMTFIPASEREKRLASGLHAVDLGASPGGWTYQLVRRGMMVVAVDNGPMATSLMDTGQVKHLQMDGFKYIPKKTNVHWLVCDMVEKPAKVAHLMAMWLVHGYCREAIFNLKLPMKRRFQQLNECIGLIEQLMVKHAIEYQLQAKQLYHDREEITLHLCVNSVLREQ